MATQRQEAWDFESFPHVDAYSQDYWAKVGRLLHQTVVEVVRASGDKQGAGMAADVKANPTQFSESLKDEAVKNFSVKWLPRVIAADRDNRLLKLLCRIKRMEPKPLPVETPEEKLRRLVVKCESIGPVGRTMLTETFGPDGAEEIVRAFGEALP